ALRRWNGPSWPGASFPGGGRPIVATPLSGPRNNGFIPTALPHHRDPGGERRTAVPGALRDRVRAALLRRLDARDRVQPAPPRPQRRRTHRPGDRRPPARRHRPPPPGGGRWPARRPARAAVAPAGATGSARGELSVAPAVRC